MRKIEWDKWTKSKKFKNVYLRMGRMGKKIYLQAKKGKRGKPKFVK